MRSFSTIEDRSAPIIRTQIGHYAGSGPAGATERRTAGYDRYLLVSMPCSAMSFSNVSRISSG